MEAPQSARKGFTLLELLLVIAIIAILAGLIIFNLNPAQRLSDTNNAKVRSDVEAIASATALYIMDKQGRHASLGDLTTARTVGNSLTLYKAAVVTGGYITALPTAPSGYSQYKIQKSATGLVTVTGRLSDGSVVTVQR